MSKTPYHRDISDKILKLFKKFPVIALTGPRQAGKSTLIRHLFPDLPYLNLEELATYQFASEDPVGFIKHHNQGVIIDEAQRVPELFRAIQVEVDRKNSKAKYLLSGSQNFLLMRDIGQTLAGRVAVLNLLPFSISELKQAKLKLDLEETIFHGGYPRIHAEKIEPTDWLPSYTRTYLERDIRDLKNVNDLSQFQRFIVALAARIGSQIDFTGIGNDIGVSHNTIRSWMSLLETSFIATTLQPYHKNYNKRLTKTPKVYFYDTGLACSVLGIRSKDELVGHKMRGPLFENLILNEYQKYYLNLGESPKLYYWKDKKSEVDCLIETSYDTIIPIEFKSGHSLSADQFKGIRYFLGLSEINQGFLIFGGDKSQKREDVSVYPWNECLKPIKK